VGPTIAEVELVDELLTQRQRRQRRRGTVDEAQVEVIELGLTDQPAIGQLELVQMRAVPAGERGVELISAKAVATSCAAPSMMAHMSPGATASTCRVRVPIRSTSLGEPRQEA
jgi:hypothetical protein